MRDRCKNCGNLELFHTSVFACQNFETTGDYSMPDKPKIIGGPVAHMWAQILQDMMARSGSNDIDLVECDADGNEIRRVRLENAHLLKVEVHEDDDIVEHAATLTYDQPVAATGKKVPLETNLTPEMRDAIVSGKDMDETLQEKYQASLNDEARKIDKKIMGDDASDS